MSEFDHTIISITHANPYVPGQTRSDVVRIDPAHVLTIIRHLVEKHGPDLVAIEEWTVPAMEVDDHGNVWTAGRHSYSLFMGEAYHIGTTDAWNRECVTQFCHRYCIDPATVVDSLPKVVASKPVPSWMAEGPAHD